MSANGTMLRPNLRAKNHSGKIDAAVRVVGGCRGSEPAVLSFANTWGIKVSVVRSEFLFFVPSIPDSWT